MKHLLYEMLERCTSLLRNAGMVKSISGLRMGSKKNESAAKNRRGLGGQVEGDWIGINSIRLRIPPEDRRLFGNILRTPFLCVQDS